MKLKEYIQKLEEVAKDYPNIDVIYSCDEEGNRYSLVFYDPTKGEYCKKHGDFDPEGKINAVCIN